MFGNAEEVYDLIIFEYQSPWTAERIKKNIFAKLLVFRSYKLEKLHTKMCTNGKREVRRLPNGHLIPGSYLLFGKKIIHRNSILSKAIVIEDNI